MSDAMAAPARHTDPVTVEIWSDIVCPWCYVGKRRFDTALARVTARLTDDDAADPLPELVRVMYRPFQLDPTAPAGSAVPVRQVYEAKFGGAERADAIFAHLTEVGAVDGIDFRFDDAVRSNTLLAHQALWMAEHDPEADQAVLKERLMAAYFTEGRNVGDPEVVAECASEAGMDPVDVAARLDTAEGRAEVTELLARAASHGITAVPTYVIDGRWAVPGAQDVEVFERILDRMLSRRGLTESADGSDD